jgi:hypothetical protein
VAQKAVGSSPIIRPIIIYITNYQYYFMDPEITIAEYAQERAALITAADRLFMTGRMLVKETFQDTPAPATHQLKSLNIWRPNSVLWDEQ